MDKTYKNYKQTMAIIILTIIVSLYDAIILLPYSFVGSMFFVGMTTLMIVMATLEYKNPKNKEARNIYKHAKYIKP